ncbi:hypothetical protein CQR79_04235, partial [Aggregatibacter actinomycetemcomitans]
MSEQKKQTVLNLTKHNQFESPEIPNVAYPLKPKNNTNVSQQYFNCLAGDESARFLFNNSGLWHNVRTKKANSTKSNKT